TSFCRSVASAEIRATGFPASIPSSAGCLGGRVRFPGSEPFSWSTRAVDGAKTFEFDRQPAYSRLGLAAELNAFHWDELQRSAQEILGELEKTNDRTLIIDLTKLDYLGSAQLTLLVRLWKVIKGRDGRMIVELKTPVVREVLKTAGLLNVWEVVESRDAAFRLLGLQADGRQKMTATLPLIGLTALVAAIVGIAV